MSCIHREFGRKRDECGENWIRIIRIQTNFFDIVVFRMNHINNSLMCPLGGGQAVRLDCRVACIMHGLPLFEDTYTVRGSYPAVARGGGGRQRGARDQNITWKYEGGDTRGRTATIPWTAESFFWRLEILGVSHTTLRSRRAGIAKCGQTSVIPPCKNPSNKSCLLSFFCAPILQWFAPLLTSGSVGKIHQNDLVPKALKKISDHFSSVVWIIFLGSQIGGPLAPPTLLAGCDWLVFWKKNEWLILDQEMTPNPRKSRRFGLESLRFGIFLRLQKGPKIAFQLILFIKFDKNRLEKQKNSGAKCQGIYIFFCFPGGGESLDQPGPEGEVSAPTHPPWGGWVFNWSNNIK